MAIDPGVVRATGGIGGLGTGISVVPTIERQPAQNRLMQILSGNAPVIQQRGPRSPAGAQRIADVLQRRAAQTTPVYGVGDAMAALGNPIFAGLAQRRADTALENQRKRKLEAEQAKQKQYMGALASAIERAKEQQVEGEFEMGAGEPVMETVPGMPIAESMATSTNADVAKLGAEAMLRQALQKPGTTSRVLSAEEAQAFGFAPGTVVTQDSAGNIEVEQEPPKQQGPLSGAGKLAADLSAGRITQEQYDAAIKARNKPLVEMGAQETAEAKEFGKSLVNQYNSVATRADAAEQENTQLEVARRIGVETGALEPLKAAVSAIAESLGIDPESIGLESATNAQAYRGILNNLVLTKMQAQKGPQTENDAKRIEQTLANLSNTKDANDFLIRTAIALNNRRIEQRNFYESFRQRTGTLDGARTAWGKFKSETPLVGVSRANGLPVFYSEFRAGAKERNPQASEDDILALWRESAG